MTETPDDKDEFLERYLLNELSEPENEELEDEMVLDKELLERVQAVEMCLIDSYVADEMSPAERLRFERGFLLFPDNRLKVEDARALHETLHIIRKEQSAGQGSQTEILPPVQPAGVAADAATRRRGWFLRLPTPVLALAAMLLLAVGSGLFLIPWRDVFKSQTDNLSVKVTPTPQTTPGDNPNRTATNQNAPAPPEQHPTPTPEMAALPPKTVYETIKEQPGFIVSGASRGAGTDSAKVRPVSVTKGSEFLMLTMTLLPERQVANDRPLSVAVYDAHNLDSPLFPSGDGLRLTPKRVGSKHAYAVTLRIPTSLLRDERTYYVRIDEEPKATPIRIKMTGAER